MIAVADTGPINYLVVIESDWLLPRLFGSLLVPPRVLSELRDSGAPAVVREWMGRLPDWVIERSPTHRLFAEEVDAGEAEALALAHEVGGALVSDDGEALKLARREGMLAFGTLGILQRAHALSWIEIDEALAALGRTNYYHTHALFERTARGAREMRRKREG